jgi:hypothetical protein
MNPVWQEISTASSGTDKIEEEVSTASVPAQAALILESNETSNLDSLTDSSAAVEVGALPAQDPYVADEDIDDKFGLTYTRIYRCIDGYVSVFTMTASVKVNKVQSCYCHGAGAVRRCRFA